MTDWFASTAYMVSIHLVVILVHVLCPSRVVPGYACDVQTKEPLVYHLNGFRCLTIVLALFCLLPSEWKLFLPRHYGECAVISNVIGLVASYYFVYVRYPSVLSSAEQKANRLRRAPTTAVTNGDHRPLHPLDLDDRTPLFYWGREFNPRWNVGGAFLLDVKMVLYAVGAVVLGLNILSAVLYEQTLRPDGSNSNAILLYAGLFLWFLLDYMWYEQVHLYTYDLFAEKIGFKLLWGCLCFYPFFYPIGILPFVMADLDSNTNDLSLPVMIAIGLVYMIGSIFTRGANLQKFYYRLHPERETVSVFGGMLLLKQETVPSSNHRLLRSGFWGLSRHINYFGEILQAAALALPAWMYLTDSFWRWIPWLYPLYYVALFIPRQQDDDALMRQKYGDKIMNEYIQLVPYRMVPFVY